MAISLTTDFLDNVKSYIQTQINNNWSYLGVGTGTTGATPSDSSLETEVLRKAREQITENPDSSVVSMWVASTEANGNDVSELGAFDSSSNGTMKVRETFTPMTKTNTKEFWFDIKINISVTQ